MKPTTLLKIFGFKKEEHYWVNADIKAFTVGYRTTLKFNDSKVVIHNVNDLRKFLEGAFEL